MLECIGHKFAGEQDRGGRVEGTFQAPMAARTSPRAAAVAGCPAVSVMRSLRGAAGWVSAIVSIWVSLPRWWSRSGLPRLTVAASPSEPWSSCLAPGLPVATQILMQLAVRDIGQLTDLLRVGMTSKSATVYDAGAPRRTRSSGSGGR